MLEENPNDAKTIVQKVILAAQARRGKKIVENGQHETVMSIWLTGKLSDCSETDLQPWIFLVREMQNLKQGRDRNFKLFYH